jgi:cyclic beta-1,2-glucan synthetase
MWFAPAGSAAISAVLAVTHPAALLPAAPLLLLWFASPGIAAWISQPRRPAEERLGASERAHLRRLARRTWLYFETFVGPEDNWLPPDNFQEAPYPEVAHRTSPTNVGMMLLSYLTAWDLGYVGSADFAARSRNALDTLDRLDRYRGHLLNWYDTRLLDPLEPRYVSTVDSGNLAVCLVALKEGCAAAAGAPALRMEAWDGLADTISLLIEALDVISGDFAKELRFRAAAIVERASSVRDRPEMWRAVLNDVSERECPELEAMIGRAIALPEMLPADAVRAVHTWLGRVHHHLSGMRRDIDTLYPWCALTDAPAPGCEMLARRVGEALAPSLSLAAIADACQGVSEMLAAAVAEPPAGEAAAGWCSELAAAVRRGAEAQGKLRAELIDVATRSEATAFGMDFQLLYDHESRLFHIGYNVSSDRLDQHHYDLLASEARLASYFAIAKKDVPVEHWFFLGRPIARLEVGLSLVSWNGSMFEYLMPPLLLRSGRGTLVDQSERAAVDLQRRYADRLSMPWGISESAFAAFDPDHHYRYHAFGVPGLGLRRGLSRDLVIAPYASALALAAKPRAAVANLRVLKRLGLIGVYGFFDAADFTPERVPARRAFSAVRTYMAHHQGMILAAIGNALGDDVHVRRFRENRRMRSMELLLQERVPWELPADEPREEKRPSPAPPPEAVGAPHAWVPPTVATFPQMHLLGNGRLASWVSEAGGGGLWWNQQALTRWRPDAVRDNHGLWIYVRDEESEAVWSVGRQPTGVISEDARVVFHPHLAEFHRRDHGIGIRMEVGVAPGEDMEIRRITVVNESDRQRVISLISYAEVVLAPPLDDERHPAFSKLFVGSEYLAGRSALLFTRRPRNPDDRPPVLLHCVVSDEAGLEFAGFETDRRAFLGRNGNERLPRGVSDGLSSSVGWTLDPVMSLQVNLELEPNERRHLAFLTFAGGSRESVMELAERHATLASLDWTLGDAATEAARESQELGLEPERLPELQTLASLLLHPHPVVRAAPSEIAANRLGQPRLWGLGLSGDIPILLIGASDPQDLSLLRVLLRALPLWRRRGFRADIVVLRIGSSGYVEPVRDKILSLISSVGAHDLLGRKGGVHLLFADQIGMDETRLLEAVARVVLDETRGSLAQQLAAAAEPRPRLPRFQPSATRRPEPVTSALTRPTDLAFDNGLGGFAGDGREYVIHLAPGTHTPAPWCNVLANDEFGCIVTEAGGGFTWAVNSGENRLTPWTNDPVADGPSEALYLRDEETAEIWTPTPQPAGSAAPCEIRHGAGYSTWRQSSHGMEQELVVFVPLDQPVKVARLRLRNLSPQARRVTATYYAEWLLGALPSISRPHVVCEYDARCQALMARNPWHPDFSDRVAFLTSSHAPHSLTTDRLDFLGREGDPHQPAGLRRWDLGGRIKPGTDPCAAFQVHLDFGVEGTTEVVFVLGQGRDRSQAEELARRWKEPARVESALREVTRHWDRLLGAIRVHTPDPAFDLMLNRWLLYQVLSSRVLARAGFYQAGGALGFRDQLQDVLSLLHADPARARAHIIAAAARQFEEGDVLHWWHPPCDRGVRTRCSDDLLWLPYVASRYVEATGDLSILSEEVPFLRGPPLRPDEEDRYARFETTADKRPLFEHCERALERGVTRGAHGLPLIGSGDWNDGMNRVGQHGRGESVWLAWFAIATMTGFAGLANRLGRSDLGETWTRRADELRQTTEATAWDGRWYLRAFDDDGRAWGSALSDECRIDSITQSWAVLAGGEPSERARAAVAAAAGELVRDDDRLVRLLWPPFQDTPRDPGYIKAYPPGIRENGGQYTHGAAWLGLAFATIGDGDSAHHIFDLLNPIRHAASPAAAERFRVEPYVIAADVAGVAPHTGRGGWTWYTGSAAWTWRLGFEGILGLRLREGELIIDPCLPKDWGSAEVEVRGPSGTLAIRIEDPDRCGRGAVEITVNGVPRKRGAVAFPTDGSVSNVVVRLGRLRLTETADKKREVVGTPYSGA